MVKKLIFTLTHIGAVSRHHYGNGSTGLLKFIYYSLVKLNTFIIYQCDLTKPLPQITLDKRFQILKPTLQELNALRMGKALPREFYSDRFHKVKTCYIALHGGDLAYIHWVYFNGDYSRFLRLRREVVEINHVTTLPAFRGQHISAKMLVATAKDLQEAGYKKLC